MPADIRTKYGMETLEGITGTLRVYALKSAKIQELENQLDLENGDIPVTNYGLVLDEKAKYVDNKKNQFLLNQLSWALSDYALFVYHTLYANVFVVNKRSKVETMTSCSRLLLYSNVNSKFFSFLYGIKTNGTNFEFIQEEIGTSLYYLNLTSPNDIRPFFIHTELYESDRSGQSGVFDKFHCNLVPIADYGKDFTNRTINRFMTFPTFEPESFNNEYLTNVLPQAYLENRKWHDKTLS